MTDIPKELIPTIVLLWMQMHTARRRGVLSGGHCSFDTPLPCPQCGQDAMNVSISAVGVFHVRCWNLGCFVHGHVSSLMPAGPDSVGIADLATMQAGESNGEVTP